MQGICGKCLVGWVARVVVTVLLLSAGVQAAYKPVDISDITGEERKAWAEVTAEMRRMSPETRDCFICEQLGLMFSKDYSRVLSDSDGYPATDNKERAYFVGRGGKPLRWWWLNGAKKEARARWDKCYFATRKFKTEALFVPFKKEVQKVVLNTARYLLKTMPKEHRWMVLASMEDMLYNDKGAYDRGRDNWGMEDGLKAKAPVEEGRGYKFLAPDGKECEIRKLLESQKEGLWRWRQIVWRCENLVGAKGILAFFPEEVKAMREHYKGQASKEKEVGKEKNEAMLVAADEVMSSLTESQRLSRIAKAVGLYYSVHNNGGYNPNYNWLNPDVVILLPDGKKCTWKEVMDEKPGPLQKIPQDAILEFYRQPIEQMARNIAGARFKEMPSLLRDMLRAQLSHNLIKLDGSPAETEKSTCDVQTFDRSWQVPVDVPKDFEHTYFRSTAGKLLPFSLYKTYESDYSHTISLVNLCARILGEDEAVKLIPPGAEE